MTNAKKKKTTKRTAKKKSASKDASKGDRLAIVWRDPNELRPYENNPRLNDRAVADVAKSIEKYGWRQPIVVDGDGVIIVGHTRWKAARRLGLKSIPVHVAGDMDPEQAKQYRIADNKSSERSEWDTDKLAEELLDLRGLGCDLTDLGFSEQEVDKYLDRLADELEPPEVEFAQELDEESNYVVLKFDRDVDFLQVQTLLGLKSVRNRTYSGKPGKSGIGRVVDGVEAIRLIQQSGQGVG